MDTAAVAAPDRASPPGELGLGDVAGLAPGAVLARLGSGPDGLTSAEAARRLRQFGPNELGTHRVSAVAVVLRQVRNPVLVLLLAAALVSGLTGGGTNALIIAVIVMASVGLGFVNEYRAERAMAALRAQIRQQAEVRRDGQVGQVPVLDLVPGDVVALRVGVIVPADLRVLTAAELECDEGVLTGESMPAAKSAAPAAGDGPQDQPGCAFMGTVVHQGGGTGVVVRTGAGTAFGQIAAGLAEKHGQTAFEAGLSRFSRFLFAVAAVLTVGIFAINVALSRPLVDALLFSLAIAVGIAPEMMPAIVTVSLSAGSKALAAKKVLVKRLVAIEDLGNIEILFTDKTGTLTEGAITFERALGPGGGDSARPLLLGLVCNEATRSGGAVVGGNALDRALWSAPADDVLEHAAAYERLAVLPFDHERQLASVLVKDGSGQPLVITKGAPEVVLDRCAQVPAGSLAGARGIVRRGRAGGGRGHAPGRGHPGADLRGRARADAGGLPDLR